MFEVVPTIYYQLFTLFIPFVDFAFPACYALMSRKTTVLYVKVFQEAGAAIRIGVCDDGL